MYSNSHNLKVAIVAYHWDRRIMDRPNMVAMAIRDRFADAHLTIVASSFDHFGKLRRHDTRALLVDVRGYEKNASFDRVLSYCDFAKRLTDLSALREADIVYICVPDYISAAVVLQMARDRQAVVVDVVDLWPEAFPVGTHILAMLKAMFLRPAKLLRRCVFERADVIAFQSMRFLRCFGNCAARRVMLPMALPDIGGSVELSRPNVEHELRIIFLGSMNHITDVECLILLLSGLSRRRKVVLDIIGVGVALDGLLRRLSDSRVKINVLGAIFDSALKAKYLDRAHFGFNGYRARTDVSVSYKGIEYLRAGLPIINRTKEGLADIVHQYRCGFNYTEDVIDATVENIALLSKEDWGDMSRQARIAFEANFTLSKFREALGGVLESLLVQREGRSRAI